VKTEASQGRRLDHTYDERRVGILRDMAKRTKRHVYRDISVPTPCTINR